MSIESICDWFSAVGYEWFPAMADVAVKGMAILLLTWLATLAMWRASASARHLVWFLGTLCVMVLPILSATLPGWYILPKWTISSTPSPQPQTAPTVFPILQPETSQLSPEENHQKLDTNVIPLYVPPQPHSAFTPPALVPPSPAKNIAIPAQSPFNLHLGWQGWALLAWSVGALLYLGYMLAACLSLWRIRRRSSVVTDPTWLALLEESKTTLQFHLPVELLASPQRAMPMTWGLTRTRILVPVDCSHWTVAQRRAVLLHELAHAKRLDCQTQLIAHLACACHWFNPLVWFAWRQMQAEREQACDDLVLSSGTKASAYAEQLLQIATEMPSIKFSAAAIAMARPSKLEGRLLAILDVKRNRRALSWTAGCVALCVMAAFAAPLAMLRADNTPETPAMSAVSRWAAARGWKAQNVAPTTLESKFGGWRNLPFTLSADEEADVKACIDLSQKVNYRINGKTEFSDAATRDALQAVLKKHPENFYAEFLLSNWLRDQGDASRASGLLDAAYQHAPVIVVERFELPDGSPAANTPVAHFALECNRVQNGSLDPSLQLSYPELKTDAEGCIYLPVYNTVYRTNDTSWPDGYAADFPKLGWFETSHKVALLPVVSLTATPSEKPKPVAAVQQQPATQPAASVVQQPGQTIVLFVHNNLVYMRMGDTVRKAPRIEIQLLGGDQYMAEKYDWLGRISCHRTGSTAGVMGDRIEIPPSGAIGAWGGPAIWLKTAADIKFMDSPTTRPATQPTTSTKQIGNATIPADVLAIAAQLEQAHSKVGSVEFDYDASFTSADGTHSVSHGHMRQVDGKGWEQASEDHQDIIMPGKSIRTVKVKSFVGESSAARWAESEKQLELNTFSTPAEQRRVAESSDHESPHPEAYAFGDGAQGLRHVLAEASANKWTKAEIHEEPTADPNVKRVIVNAKISRETVEPNDRQTFDIDISRGPFVKRSQIFSNGDLFRDVTTEVADVTGSGDWYPSRIVIRDYGLNGPQTADDKRFPPERTVEIRVSNVKLVKAFPPETFTIKSLNLPIGTRIFQTDASGKKTREMKWSAMGTVIPADAIEYADAAGSTDGKAESPTPTTRPATQSGTVFVMGKVARTGAYSIPKEGLTLRQLVISAGRDSLNCIVGLHRHSGRDYEEFDLADVASGRVTDPPLEAGDVAIVTDRVRATTAPTGRPTAIAPATNPASEIYVSGVAATSTTQPVAGSRVDHVSDVVGDVVNTISTCAEGDPRIAGALAKLKGLDEAMVVKETAGFLVSTEDNTRRAAIYILWRGEFKSIGPAIEPLIEACKRKEDLTRGMAALALGGKHAGAGKATLIAMATADKSPYARRCAAYALGLLGDPSALPTLQTLASDADPQVGNNAKAAIKMLNAATKPTTQRAAVGLNADQQLVLQWTDDQFRQFFDARTFDGWSDAEKSKLESRCIDALKGPMDQEYYQSIGTLAALKSTKGLSALREIAFDRRDKNNRDRWMAIRALGLMGDRESVPQLIHLVYHGNTNTHWWAQISLVRLTGQNFGSDWQAWGKWWNAGGNRPTFDPTMIRWWAGQAEPEQLAKTLADQDEKFLAPLRARRDGKQTN